MKATATFLSRKLTVTKSGTGTGTVTSTPAGINCGSTCAGQFVSGTSVTLRATPATGSRFANWGGACSGTSTTCTVAMTADRTVLATFASLGGTQTLTVMRAGTGTGTVTSSPSGISCGSTCSKAFTSGTVVTLTAAAATGSHFGGWSGACTGTGATCSVTMSAAKSVRATFVKSAQIAFRNNTCLGHTCQSYTQTLTTGQGYTWVSASGQWSAYKPVRHATLSGFVATSAELGPITFGGTFSVTPGQKYELDLVWTGSAFRLDVYGPTPLSTTDGDSTVRDRDVPMSMHSATVIDRSRVRDMPATR